MFSPESLRFCGIPRGRACPIYTRAGPERKQVLLEIPFPGPLCTSMSILRVELCALNSYPISAGEIGTSLLAGWVFFFFSCTGYPNCMQVPLSFSEHFRPAVRIRPKTTTTNCWHAQDSPATPHRSAPTSPASSLHHLPFHLHHPIIFHNPHRP